MQISGLRGGKGRGARPRRRRQQRQRRRRAHGPAAAGFFRASRGTSSSLALSSMPPSAKAASLPARRAVRGVGALAAAGAFLAFFAGS